MTVKQQINHGAIFIPFIWSHYQFYSFTSPVLFTKDNKLCIREKKICLYMTASVYPVRSKEVENRTFRHKCLNDFVKVSKLKLQILHIKEPRR